MNIEIMPLSQAVEEFNILVALGLFVLYLIIEMLDSSLVFSLTQHKSYRSAIVTFVLYLTLAIEIGAIVSNYLYVIPVAIGGAIASYVVVEHEKRKEDKEE